MDYKPEVVFAPGSWAAQPTDKDRRISEMMASYWVNFARTGNPAGAGLPKWGLAKQPTPETLVIDDVAESAPDFRKAQLQLWFDIWEKQTGLMIE